MRKIVLAALTATILLPTSSIAQKVSDETDRAYLCALNNKLYSVGSPVNSQGEWRICAFDPEQGRSFWADRSDAQLLNEDQRSLLLNI